MMDNSSSAWMEHDWECEDFRAPIQPLITQLEPNTSNSVTGTQTTEIPGSTGLFNSIGGEALHILAEDLDALNMCASGPPLLSQHVDFKPQEPSQQYGNNIFQEGDISFESMGCHFLDDWVMTYDAPTQVSSGPPYGVNPYLMPANFPIGSTQSILPFRQNCMDQFMGLGLTATNFNGIGCEGFDATSSLAVEASTTLGSPGSQSIHDHRLPASQSPGSSGEPPQYRENSRISPQRSRMPKPKQIYPCNFSSCFRTFEKKFELR